MLRMPSFYIWGQGTFSRGALSLLLLSASSEAWGKDLAGKVLKVESPTRILIEDKAHKKIKVEILSIVVPKQTWKMAADTLKKAVLKRPVTVEWYEDASKCRSGPHCVRRGKVLSGATDVGLLLVQAGLAFHNQATTSFQSTSDRALFREGEEQARIKSRGIWARGRP